MLLINLKTLNKVPNRQLKLSLEIGFGQIHPIIPEKSGSEKILGCGDPRYKHENHEEIGIENVNVNFEQISGITRSCM